MRGGRPSVRFVDDIVPTIWAPRSAAISKLGGCRVRRYTTIFQERFLHIDIYIVMNDGLDLES